MIGAFYYLRIVYFMYFGEERDAIQTPMNAYNWAALVGAAVIMVAGVVNLFGVEALAAAAAETLVN